MICSSAIRELYGALASSLVWATTGFCQSDVLAGAELHGPAVSAFRGAYLMLRKLRVASLDEILLVDSYKVADFVNGEVLSGQFELPPIDDAINAWLALFADQLEYASLMREPFLPHQNINFVMDALTVCGYAERINDTFMWTDKIGSAMHMSGWWDENGLSHEELEKRDIGMDVRKALVAIPADVRQAALNNNHVAVFQALAVRWIDGVWLPDTVDEALWQRLAALAPKAKRLVELVRDKDYPNIYATNQTV